MATPLTGERVRRLASFFEGVSDFEDSTFGFPHSAASWQSHFEQHDKQEMNGDHQNHRAGCGQPPLRAQAPHHSPRKGERAGGKDRKSTRLNSSHGYISYAVFCLKKKKKKK